MRNQQPRGRAKDDIVQKVYRRLKLYIKEWMLIMDTDSLQPDSEKQKEQDKEISDVHCTNIGEMDKLQPNLYRFTQNVGYIVIYMQTQFIFKFNVE